MTQNIQSLSRRYTNVFVIKFMHGIYNHTPDTNNCDFILIQPVGLCRMMGGGFVKQNNVP